MEPFEAHTSALVFSAALLLVAAGLAKKQLVWKRRKPVPARRRSSFITSLLPFKQKVMGGKWQ